MLFPIGQGTGLGLSICQRIMQQHNSAITVRSVPGDTAFDFTLPVTDEEPRIVTRT